MAGGSWVNEICKAGCLTYPLMAGEVELTSVVVGVAKVERLGEAPVSDVPVRPMYHRFTAASGRDIGKQPLVLVLDAFPQSFRAVSILNSL